MGFVILGFAFSGFLSMRQSFVGDTGVADVNQRLKTIFASIAPDMIQVGEGLTDTDLPLLEITQRTIPNTNPVEKTSDITIRRTLLPQTLTSCTAITALSTTKPLVVDESSTNSLCKRNDNENPKDGWPDTLKLWNQKRNNDPGTIKAYIYDRSTNRGEFFDYKGEIIKKADGTTITNPNTTTKIVETVNLDTNDHTWTNNYPEGSIIYLMDKRQYQVDLDQKKLKLIVNDQVEDTFELTENLDKLDITATLNKLDDTTGNTTEHLCKVITEAGGPTSCTPSFPNPTTEYKFNQIKSIEISATVKENEDSSKKLRKDEDLTMSQKFYPRNSMN